MASDWYSPAWPTTKPASRGEEKERHREGSRPPNLPCLLPEAPSVRLLCRDVHCQASVVGTTSHGTQKSKHKNPTRCRGCSRH